MDHYSEAVERPWGRFYIVHSKPELWVKTLVLKPWSQTSLQIHESRDEHWHVAEAGLHAIIGDERVVLQPDYVYTVLRRAPHRIINSTIYERVLVEVATGQPDEDDIERLEDSYGRV